MRQVSSAEWRARALMLSWSLSLGLAVGCEVATTDDPSGETDTAGQTDGAQDGTDGAQDGTDGAQDGTDGTDGGGCGPGLETKGRTCADIDECKTGTPCGVGTCSNSYASYSCSCPNGYSSTGTTCVDVDECTQGIANCGPKASCNNTEGSYVCTCNEGTTGDGKVCCEAGYEKSGAACSEINECTKGLDNCDDNAACANTSGSFTCKCKAGFDGDGVTCDDVNECDTGAAKCDVNATCNNTPGSFTCDCNEGYIGSGTSCAVKPPDGCPDGFKKSGAICSDIHECNEGLDNCDDNAACANTSGSFTCKCKTGYDGDGVTCSNIDECATQTDNCDSTTVCNDTVGSFTCDCEPGYAKAGSKCFDVDECLLETDDCPAFCDNLPGSYQCLSTVADVNSPYYTRSCDPTFSFHQYSWSGTAPNETYEYMTQLVADCRCGGNRQSVAVGGLAICQNPEEVPLAVSFGTGPSVRSLPNASILGGAFDADARIMYVGVEWQDAFYEDQGAVLAIDADTGDRTIISGQWLDPSDGYVTYGESDPSQKTFWSENIIGAPAYKNPLGRVYDIEQGADGYLYAMTADKDNYTHIVRVDVATGARKVMWTEKRSLDPNNQNEPAHIQCPNGSVTPGGSTWVQLNQNAGFELDTNGDYLLPVIQGGASTSITPNGVVRIAKDGSACEWVTRFGAGSANTFYTQAIGTGPLAQFAFDALYLHSGKLYAVSGNGDTYTIDPTTGKRSIVASDAVGAGPLPGLDWLEWDAGRQLMWTGGTGLGTTLVSWNLTSGVRFDHIGLKLAKPADFQTASGPLDTCCGTHRPGWVDPLNGQLLLVHGVYGVVRFEPESGNSVLLSL